MSTRNQEVDQLQYVRKRLAEMQPADLPRVAVDAGIAQRTLYNVIKGVRDVKYGTVMRLVAALKAGDKKAIKKVKP